MKRKAVGIKYHYQYFDELLDELGKRGFHFIVKWDGRYPNGIEWLGEKPPTRFKIIREIEDILGVEPRTIESFEFIFGVEEVDDYYQQYLRHISIVSNKEIVDN